MGYGTLAQSSANWYRDPALSPLLIQAMASDNAGFRWSAIEGVVQRGA